MRPPPVPAIEPEKVPLLAVRAVADPRWTVPLPFRVVTELVGPLRFSAPPEIVPMVATPVTVSVPLATVPMEAVPATVAAPVSN